MSNQKKTIEPKLDFLIVDHEIRSPNCFQLVKLGDCESIRKIITHSNHVDVNAKNIEGKTMLHIASECGHCEIVEFLVYEMNADLSLLDNDFSTALSIASNLNYHKVTTIILDKIDSSIEIVKRREEEKAQKSPRDFKSFEELLKTNRIMHKELIRESGMNKSLESRISHYRKLAHTLRKEILSLKLSVNKERNKLILESQKSFARKNEVSYLKEVLEKEKKKRQELIFQVDELRRAAVRNQYKSSKKSTKFTQSELEQIDLMKLEIDRLKRRGRALSESISPRNINILSTPESGNHVKTDQTSPLFVHEKLKRDYKKQQRRIEQLETENEDYKIIIKDLKDNLLQVQMRQRRKDLLGIDDKILRRTNSSDAELITPPTPSKLKAFKITLSDTESDATEEESEEATGLRKPLSDEKKKRRKSISIQLDESDIRWVRVKQFFIGETCNNELVVKRNEKVLILGLCSDYLYAVKKDGKAGFIPTRLVDITNELRESLDTLSDDNIYKKMKRSSKELQVVDVVRLPLDYQHQLRMEEKKRQQAYKERKEKREKRKKRKRPLERRLRNFQRKKNRIILGFNKRPYRRYRRTNPSKVDVQKKLEYLYNYTYHLL